LVEADRVGRLRGRHHYVRQHLDGQLQDVSPSLLPLPWDPGHMELPKLQPLWDDPCKVIITHVNVFFRFQLHPTAKMMTVYQDGCLLGCSAV
jgi:hypothetical protein